jgi:cytoskeletal protein CcmA (bactofilin family)
MFRRGGDRAGDEAQAPDRVDSVLGPGLTWKGELAGSGGVRIEGAFDGGIQLHGLVVVGERGRVTCEELQAVTVVVAGSVKGNIRAQRLEIMGSGRVWGDVTTVSLSTEDGAFLRGQITMEETLDLGFQEPTAEAGDRAADESKDEAEPEVGEAEQG